MTFCVYYIPLPRKKPIILKDIANISYFYKNNKLVCNGFSEILSLIGC